LAPIGRAAFAARAPEWDEWDKRWKIRSGDSGERIVDDREGGAIRMEN